MSAVAQAPQHTRPLWFAALITCCAAPLVIATVFVVEALVRQGVPAREHVIAAFSNIVMFAFPVTVGAVLLLGMPLAFWLRDRDRLTFRNLAIAGACLGAVIPVFLLFNLVVRQGRVLLFAACCGAITSSLFALVAGVRWRRAAP